MALQIPKFTLLMLICLFCVENIFAQEATPEATESAVEEASIELEPFSIQPGDEQLNGVIPKDWNQIQAGVAVREDEVTYILHIVQPDSTIEDAVAPILESIGLDELPDSSEAFEGQVFSWDVYALLYQPAQAQDTELQVGIAIADSDAGAYLIVLQAMPDEYEELFESVMQPALDTFGLSLDDVRAYLGLPDFTTITLDTLTVDVPAHWGNPNPGAYLRRETETDFTTLLVNASADFSEREFVDLLLETMGLQLALSDDPTETLEYEFVWSVYRLDFDAQGTPVTLHIATTTDDSQTIMVALLATEDEADVLMERIFMPILSSVHAENDD